MPSDNVQTPAEQGQQDFLLTPFGLLTTSGEVEVIKAADVEKDSANKEETR